jgi:hypothetical protein
MAQTPVAAQFWARAHPGGPRRGCVQAAFVATSHTSSQARLGSPGSAKPPHRLIEWLCAPGALDPTHNVRADSVLRPRRASSKNTHFLTHIDMLCSCRAIFCPHRLGHSYNVPRPRSGPRGGAHIGHKTSAGGPECCLFGPFRG